ncbi:hypothetical protein [Flavobacterium aquicola]|uniref:Uncharacterized protein n=1 Tax=Flavobacterium aquicola TaxID=1682742 RepID=A0A3E0EQL6_9FLAO|nr:hypothetical protein [Flavobacterium aquicola]REG99659.1 hypothetical protein C8P67_104289 [Flavobacterium aquicola]
MEQAIKILIYIHAFFGGLGLITGIGSIIVKKGQKLHRRMGRLFSIGMITSSLLSLPICFMPKHQNLFLFLIGIFTIYLVLAGNRAISFKFKSKTQADLTDKLISGIMMFSSIIMILIGIYCVVNAVANGVLFAFFGGFGLYMTVKDFIFFKNFTTTKNSWLTKHIGKMVGALIASITAFIVAGLGLGNLIAWMTPSIIGTLYIIYWNRKVDSKIKLQQVIE